MVVHPSLDVEIFAIPRLLLYAMASLSLHKYHMGTHSNVQLAMAAASTTLQVWLDLQFVLSRNRRSSEVLLFLPKIA